MSAQTNVTQREQLNALVGLALRTYGRVDAIINNAGIMPLSALDQLKVDEWDQMIDVNIKGVLYGIAAALPVMREQKSGHIINVSSTAGHYVLPTGAVYSGTKYAVRAISEGLRQEVMPDIRVTLISPGLTQTELDGTITDAELSDRWQIGGRGQVRQTQSREPFSSPSSNRIVLTLAKSSCGPRMRGDSFLKR